MIHIPNFGRLIGRCRFRDTEERTVTTNKSLEKQDGTKASGPGKGDEEQLRQGQAPGINVLVRRPLPTRFSGHGKEKTHRMAEPANNPHRGSKPFKSRTHKRGVGRSSGSRKRVPARCVSRRKRPTEPHDETQLSKHGEEAVLVNYRQPSRLLRRPRLLRPRGLLDSASPATFRTAPPLAAPLPPSMRFPAKQRLMAPDLLGMRATSTGTRNNLTEPSDAETIVSIGEHKEPLPASKATPKQTIPGLTSDLSNHCAGIIVCRSDCGEASAQIKNLGDDHHSVLWLRWHPGSDLM
ncbi:hypothetical protein B0T13DRAFT_444311 [Neurospora crassa]|nr:hypothetical protein B0T13DRAFT_444311 [Neurospora crassa]